MQSLGREPSASAPAYQRQQQLSATPRVPAARLHCGSRRSILVTLRVLANLCESARGDMKQPSRRTASRGPRPVGLVDSQMENCDNRELHEA